MKITWDEIENLRDELYRRTQKRQVRTMTQALDFVRSTGFCFAFKAHNSELPCLWHAACGQRNPVYPLHTHHDPYISLVWQAKDELAHTKKVYYGKAIKKRPSIISLEYFPYFYILNRQSLQPDAYLSQYMRGELSREAKMIMDALADNSPLVTADLKIASGFSHPQRRATFDKAMAELQSKMYVVKIAEFYDPFTFLWDLVDKRFADEIETAQSILKDTARKYILKKYFQTVLVASSLSIKRLFNWNLAEVESTLKSLLAEGLIIDDLLIDGEKKAFYASLQILAPAGNKILNE